MNFTTYNQLFLLSWWGLLLIFFPGVQAHAKGDFDFQNRQLTEVLEEFSEKYEVLFSYDSDILANIQVNFRFRENENLDQAINRLLAPTKLGYESFGNKYYAIYEKTKKGQRSLKKIGKHIQKIQRLEKKGSLSVQPYKKGKINQLKSVLSNVSSFGQRRPISGIITGTDGAPLIGATVRVKGQNIGTLTDNEGRFSLDIPDGEQTLIITYVGFSPTEVSVNGRTTIDISMEKVLAFLDEVIVVGYGTVKKSDLTGSVSSISVDDLDRQPITTIDQGLQGLAAGVQVQQTSGAPGGAVTMRIRGTNSISAGNEPLYVIDGLPILANNAATPASPSITGFGGNSQPGQPPSPLATISPNDIESIEILKDASATALYGARASNGVVLITTKRGKAGRGTITFDSYYGVQEISSQVDFMSADQHRAYLEQAITSGASSLSLGDLPNANTDWLGLVQRENPVIQNYTLGASGGNEKIRYSVSANYFNQEGILRNTGIDRSSLRVNMDFSPLERLRIGVSTNISYTQNQIQIQNGTGNYQTTNSPFTWAQWLSPLQVIRDADGNLLQDYFTGDPISNPEALVSNDVVNQINTFRSFGVVFAEYELLKGLKYRINFGADLSAAKRNSFFPNTHPFARQVNGLAAVSNTLLTNWLVENLLTYQLTTDKHDINLIGGVTSQKERIESTVIQGEDFQIDNLKFNSIQQAAIRDGVSGINQWSLQSFFAQVNYIFDNKYLLTANFRADGSSKFGANNRWGYFPSLALAWRIDQESFFESLSTVVSDLKLRASYGVVGNQEIPANLAFASFGASRPLNFSNDPESEGLNGLVLASLANPDLRWETTTQTNIGLDLGLFNNRINITANYYLKTTEDLLLSTPLPATSGFNFAIQNVGEVQNRGFEFSVTSINIANVENDLKWSATLNFSSNQNEVTALAEDVERTFINVPVLQNISSAFVLEVGQPLGAFFGYQFEGIYQNGEANIPDGFDVGDPKYADLSGPDGFATFWFAPQNYGNNEDIYLQNPDRRAFPSSNSFSGGRQNLQVYEGFYNSFDPNDLRKDVSIRDYSFNMTDDSGALLTSNTRWPWGVNKYNYDEVAVAVNSRDGTDRIMLRLSDVYLLLAEAINEANGPTGAAFDAINSVRQRAGLKDLSTADMIEGHFTYGNGSHNIGSVDGFRFAVLRERAWELCYEYQRRFDLNRHNYLDDVALNRWGAPGSDPTNKNYPPLLSTFPQGRELFPLPNEQVTINGWQQNPGY